MGSRADRLRIVARTMTAERVTLEVAGQLRKAAVDHVVLKGPVFARLLYDDPSTRVFGDSDFLVNPKQVEDAESVLASMGFERYWDIDFDGKKPWVERRWIRAADDAGVDLHRTLFGVRISPANAWQILSSYRTELLVKDQRIDVFDDTMNVLHVALHAAQHGTEARRPLNELDQAIERFPPHIWENVSELARQLNAMEWLSSGLRLRPAGVELADQLGIPKDMSLETALRRETAPLGAETLAWLVEMGSWKARIAYVGRTLFPPMHSMRTTYALARRGRLGLLISYPARWMWLMAQTPRALVALRNAQKAPKAKPRS